MNRFFIVGCIAVAALAIVIPMGIKKGDMSRAADRARFYEEGFIAGRRDVTVEEVCKSANGKLWLKVEGISPTYPEHDVITHYVMNCEVRMGIRGYPPQDMLK